MGTEEILYTIARWVAAIMSVIAAIGAALTLREYTGRFHSWAQWIRVLAAVFAALFIVLTLFIGRHLDQLRAEREQAQATELTQTKQALEALQARTNPRELSPIQMLQMLTLFRERPKGTVNIETPQGDHESYRFATQLASILQIAGWKVEYIAQTVYLGDQPVGIVLAAHSNDSIPSEAQTLREVFDLFGFTPTWVIATGVPKGTFALRVGHKPK